MLTLEFRGTQLPPVDMLNLMLPKDFKVCLPCSSCPAALAVQLLPCIVASASAAR